MSQKRFSVVLGLMLIVLGGISLAANLVGPLFGWGMFWWVPWRIWPLVVVALGLMFVLTPFLVKRRTGWGGMFIPGVPILATGAILLFTSVFDAWGAWAWLWPVEVWSLALGFVVAALYMHNIWLMIPAIIIGANGLLFQFCALTGWWSVWAVLWAIEPLSVGVALLVVNTAKRRRGLLIGGLVLCGIAAISMIGMTAILPEWWVLNLLGPALLVGTGFLLLLANVRPRMAEER
jgi:hypothetical protein